MSIADMFSEALGVQIGDYARLIPKCHRRHGIKSEKAHLDAYVDGKNKIVVLCCSVCDRPIAKITEGKIKKL